MKTTPPPNGTPADTMHDRVWRGYDIRAAFPLLSLAAGFSLLDLLGRWFIEDLSDFADRVGSLILFAPVAAIWVVVASIILYRTVTYTYRLTSRALLVDRGFRWPPENPLWLEDIADAQAHFTAIGRVLHVGTVKVTTRGGRVAELHGIHDPAAFADAIRAAVPAKS